jgi:ComF family protein
MTNKISQLVRTWGSDLISLLYPELCCACGATLYRGEKILCTRCLVKMPKTNYHQYKDNPVEMVFWGRVQIERATSFMLFVKGGKYQHLLHQLKYKGRKDIGIHMGELFARDLIGSEDFLKPQFIIPVPLHPDKEKKRGYNQSQMVAQGLSNILQIPINNETLYRKTFTQTQTKKSRYERWENVEEVFGVQKPENIAGKHIFLVDDVLTTGATLEGCSQILKQAADVKISILTLAYASN